MSENPTLIYTQTDEAPALATYSLLPIVKAYAKRAGIEVQTRDISLAARILAQFSDDLAEGQRKADDLAELGTWTKEREANIIKLPNISASVPQLKAAIEELQSKGYGIPDYPESPQTEQEKEVRKRYDRVKGSAVNPVLREGNSDRRAPKAVKVYAKKHPHSMGEWSSESRTRVTSMAEGDFFGNEESVMVAEPTQVRIEWVGPNGEVKVLKAKTELQAGEILDGTYMSRRSLEAFLAEQMERAKQDRLLFSLHLKATMMKVSDPVIFGCAVEVYYRALCEKHRDLFDKIGVDFRNGFGDLLGKLGKLSESERREVEETIAKVEAERVEVAMVNSDKGISNLHVPSDVIVDASMPAMIRAGGKMWDRKGQLADTLAVIPDRSYAGIYQATIDFCKQHGALDPTKMGTVPNVGLMAQAAEEYGSHDKTFEIEAAGLVRVVDESGKVLMAHQVGAGDIWRACQTKDAAVRDWVKLAVNRARATGAPAVFWLDDSRPHDRQLLIKVRAYLKEHDLEGLDIQIMEPKSACEFSLGRLAKGLDTISVTGNVLRDYNTDLFPILELGTSAKMLSIVPLMNGGGLFETGAGGSAPKHVEQLVGENYLRWDSLGEFFALVPSFEHIAETYGHGKAKVLADALDVATAEFLDQDRSPGRKLGTIDNRGSHYYLASYWAKALATQNQDKEMQAAFAPIAKALREQESVIVAELLSVQGTPADLGGYYMMDDQKAERVMRPSQTFNQVIDRI